MTNPTKYVDDDLVEPSQYECMINSTREIRRKPRRRCSPGFEQCHIAGLNMIKIFFNDEQWETREATCDKVIQIIIKHFNAKSNFICCPTEKNHVTDVKDEKYLIRALRGKNNGTFAKLNDNQRTMLTQFTKLLNDIQQELAVSVGRSVAIESILIRIRKFTMNTK